MEVLGHGRVGLQSVAQVHGAVGHVPGLVLHAQAEDLLLDLRRRQGSPGSEQRQHDPFAQEVHQRRAFVVGLRIEDELQEALDYGSGLPEPATVGQGTLAEHLSVAGLVHHLSTEEHLGFDEVVIDPPQPLGREVGGDHLDLGQHRGQLAHSVLDIRVERGEVSPRDVAGGAPLAAHRLFVEVEDVVGPHL